MARKEIILILNDIRSAHNVGSIFRTADAAGVNKIFLCGITPTPNSLVRDKISKVALGAEKNIPWEYQKQTWRLLENLKKEKINIVALERFDRLTASKLGVKNIYKHKPKYPLAILVGAEVKGLSRRILSYVDEILEIPMHGKKESLNVSVAVGVALYLIDAFSTKR